jgi:hypothetical protein
MSKITRTLSLGVVIACGTHAGITMPQNAAAQDYTSYPAGALTDRVVEAGHCVWQEGSMLKAGTHEIRIEPEIREQVQQQGRWIVAMGFRVTVDSKPIAAMRTSAVGVDAVKERAQATAAWEWSQQYGTALVRALYVKSSDAQAIAAGRYQLFQGLDGIRGPAELKIFEPTLKQLPAVVGRSAQRALAQDSSKEFHGIEIMVTCNPEKGPLALCRIDGTESPELNKAIKQLAWPTGTTYIFKKFFLAVPGK